MSIGMNYKARTLVTAYESLDLETPISGDECTTHDTGALNRAAWEAVRNSPVLMNEARGWVEDCGYPTGAIGLTVLAYVSRNYAGGIVQFYMDTRGLIPVTTNNNNKVVM